MSGIDRHRCCVALQESPRSECGFALILTEFHAGVAESEERIQDSFDSNHPHPSSPWNLREAMKCREPTRRSLALTALAVGATRPCHNSEHDPRESAQVVFGPVLRRPAALSPEMMDGSLTVAAPFIGKAGVRKR
jgi:hypothetical protein